MKRAVMRLGVVVVLGVGLAAGLPGAEDAGLKEQSSASWFAARQGLGSLSAGV